MFSELGKCWGIVVSSHNDLPDNMLDPSLMNISPPILPPPILPPNASRNSDRDDFDDKDKKKKKDKKDKKEKKKEKKKKEKEEKRMKEREEQSALEQAEFEKDLGEDYFDFKSEHCLMPLIPSSNSYNRNFVLTMGHSGVKFIIDAICKLID